MLTTPTQQTSSSGSQQEVWLTPPTAAAPQQATMLPDWSADPPIRKNSNRSNKRRAILSLGIIVSVSLMAAGLFSALQLANTQNTDDRGWARDDTNPVPMTIQVSHATVKPGDTVTAQIIIQGHADSRITGVQSEFRFDPEKFTAVSAAPSARFHQPFLVPQINNSAGRIFSGYGIRILPTQTRREFNTGQSIGSTITLRVKDSAEPGPTELSFTDAQTKLASLDSVSNVRGRITPASLTIVRDEVPPDDNEPPDDEEPPDDDVPPQLDSPTISFHVQGLLKSGVTMPVEVSFKDNAANSDASGSAISKFKVDATSSASGVLTTSHIPYPVATGSATTYSIAIKTENTLQKVISRNYRFEDQDSLHIDASDTRLLIGDFDRSTNNENKLDVADLSLLLAQYEDVTNPVTDENRRYDINYDDVIDVEDLSILLSNFTDIIVDGEEL